MVTEVCTSTDSSDRVIKRLALVEVVVVVEVLLEEEVVLVEGDPSSPVVSISSGVVVSSIGSVGVISSPASPVVVSSTTASVVVASSVIISSLVVVAGSFGRLREMLSNRNWGRAVKGVKVLLLLEVRPTERRVVLLVLILVGRTPI